MTLFVVIECNTGAYDSTWLDRDKAEARAKEMDGMVITDDVKDANNGCTFAVNCTVTPEAGETVCLHHRVHLNTHTLGAIRRTVGTLISWTAQSVNTPLSREEAEKLLDMLAGAK